MPRSGRRRGQKDGKTPRTDTLWADSASESGDLYKSILDIAGSIILILDPKGKVKLINRKGCELLGCSEYEILGRSWTANFIPRKDRKWIREVLDNIFNEHADVPPVGRNEILTASGEKRMIEWNFTLLRDDESVHGLLCSGMDRTESLRSQDELEKSRNRYQSLFEHSPGGILTADMKGIITSCNRKVLDMLDCTEEEIVGRNFTRVPFVSLKDIPRFLKILSSLVRGKVPEPFESSFYRNDGSTGWSNVSLDLFTDENGKREIQAIIIDITVMKRAANLAVLQRDLALKLNTVNTPENAVEFCLDAALKASGLEAGGIYLIEEETGDIVLQTQKGFNRGSLEKVSRYPQNSPNAEIIRKGMPLYLPYKKLMKKTGLKGWNPDIRTAAVVPVIFAGDPGGSLNLASFKLETVPEYAQYALETIASQMGAFLSRLRAEKALAESERTFRNVINSTPTGMHMYRLDKAGRLIFTGANSAADRILGVEHSQFIGKTIEEAFPPLAETEVPERYREAAEKGVPWYTEQVEYKDDKIAGAYEVHAFQFAPGRMAASFIDITERKRNQEALKASESRLKSIFSSAATGIGVVTDRKLVDVNDRVCEITGYSRDELIGKDARMLYPSKKEYEFVGREKYRLIQEQGTGTVETVWKRKDGSRINVLLSSTPPDLGNSTKNVTFTVLDITERKKAIEELERSEERLKILFEHAPEAIYLSDMKGVFLDGNRAAEEMIGYSRDELIGKSMLKAGLLSIGDIPRAAKDLALNSAGKKAGPSQYVLKRKDRKKVIAEITSYPLRIQGKRVIMGIARDVTYRKETEEELLRIRAAVDDALDGILITDTKGNALYINAAFRYLFGFSIMNLEDITFSGFFTDETLKKDIYRESLGPVGFEAEVELRSPIGRTFPAYVRGSAIRNEDLDDIGILFLISDITLRKHVDDQLKQSLLEKEMLIKEVHHRVKNNLQIVSELLFLQTSGIRDPKMIDVFRDSQTRIDTMARLHERVYLSNNLSRINISRHIQSTVEDLFETYRADPGKIDLKLDLDDLYLSIDEAVPCGLIVNELVTNVFKYAFPGDLTGTLHVSLKEEGDRDAVLTVSDNGAGFPEGVDLEHPETVGLTLVRGLAEQLDGRVEGGAVKKGTEISICFKTGVDKETE